MNPKEPLVDSNEKTESTGVADPPSSPLQSLIAERDHLLEEKAELTDRLLRRQAEFDNFRRLAER
jgi:molecular chaperone GrpE (heat shock protein)